jgi:DNA/RNA endonuclease YhcR with UshA esterase domain
LICLVARAQESTPAAEKRQPQSAVAAKQVTFGTLAAEDPKVKAATRADDLPAAKQLVGKSGSFQGTVVRVYAPSSNRVVLLDFAREYRTAVTAVVQAADFARFPDLTTVKGKRVLVTGKVSEFKGQPQIELTRPDDLKIVK